MLLSPNYLQSDFIPEGELKPLLDRAENTPAKYILLWIQLAPVPNIDTLKQGRRLLRYQAVGDPKEPWRRWRPKPGPPQSKASAPVSTRPSSRSYSVWNGLERAARRLLVWKGSTPMFKFVLTSSLFGT